MGKIILRGTLATRIINGEQQDVILLEDRKLEKFTPHVLGLGDISLPAKQLEALAAVFDLSGFTNFCNQVDPQLAVPEYLSRFLDWLFDEVRTELTARSYKGAKALWAEIPFLAKFLGDGVLFLWDTRNMSETRICSIVSLLFDVCEDYGHIFYPEIRKTVVEPPNALRCGIARGRVFSVGNGQDYVGPCINIASRLQKLSFLTFCFPRRGFDVEEYMHESFAQTFVEKCITVQGIGENELVWVLKKEFDELPDEEKKLFREP